MGLTVSRVSFLDWIEGYEEVHPGILGTVEATLGRHHVWDSWNQGDGSGQRIGSYTRYGVFNLCLLFLNGDVQESSLEEDEDIEREALQIFKDSLVPFRIDEVEHFVEVGDTDTIFLPIRFDRPMDFGEIWVASLPAAVTALECLSEGLEFSLRSPPDPETINGRWDAVATAKNVARDLFHLFTEETNVCISFG